MTRVEADRECAERNAALAGQPGVRWLVRESAPGEWGAVRVVIPGIVGPGPLGPLKTSTESGPRPGQPADPRPLVDPLWWGGLGGMS